MNNNSTVLSLTENDVGNYYFISQFYDNPEFSKALVRFIRLDSYGKVFLDVEYGISFYYRHEKVFGVPVDSTILRILYE